MVGEERVLPGAVVLHLHEGRAAVAVDQVHQLLHTRDELVVVHAVAMVPATSLGIVHGGSLDGDDPHPALGQRFVEAEGVVVHLVELVLLEGVHARGRFVDAVPRLDFADLPRFEQPGVAVASVMRLPLSLVWTPVPSDGLERVDLCEVVEHLQVEVVPLLEDLGFAPALIVVDASAALGPARALLHLLLDEAVDLAHVLLVERAACPDPGSRRSA